MLSWEPTGFNYTHSPVGLDLGGREFSICKDGGSIVTFIDETIQQHSQMIGTKKLYQLHKKQVVGVVLILKNSPTKQATSATSIPTELQSVISEFEDVF